MGVSGGMWMRSLRKVRLQSPIRHARSWLALALLCVLGVGSALAAPDAAPEAVAKEALAALAAEEATIPGARLTISVTDRRGTYVKDEKLEAMRRRLEGATPTVAEGFLTYSGDSWWKDLNVPLLRPEATTMRTRTSASGGVLRMLLEATQAGAEQRRARVIRAPSLVPADAILTRQVAKSLEGVTWTGAKKAADGLVTLTGTRRDERHEVRLARQPQPWLKGWKLTRSLTSPTGEAVEQTYWCEVTRGAVPEPIGYVEEWVLVPSANSVVSRVTQVRKTEARSEGKPEEISIRFPKGTLVTDARGDVPLEYEQSEEGVNEEEVAETARLLAQGRARAGDPAPPFLVRGEKNHPIKLSDFKGKPLAIFWFTERNRPGDGLGNNIADLSAEYLKRGVQSLVLLGSGDAMGNWEQLAAEYRKEFNWTSPIALDTDGEAMRVYGLVAAVPKVAVVDRTGKLVFVQPGFNSAAVRKALESVAEKTK